MSESRVRIAANLVGLACALAVATGAAGQTGSTGPASRPAEVPKAVEATAARDQAASNYDGLVIGPTELPNTYPHGVYVVTLQPRGKFVPPLHWRVEKGALPPGIKLEENGVLRGEPERAGEFRFTLSARDSGSPQQAVRRELVIKVVEALTLVWKIPAHVTGNRIDGSVEVTNTTADDIDLTFDVKAVAENGRATEIGYQHFPLKKGTAGMTLPFGETLPHGAYLVRVDVAGEVAQRHAIYRQGLQAPGRLQVVVGP